MSYFDEKAVRFRILFLVLFFSLLSINIINFYRLLVSPTDENWFTNTPAPFYITKDVAAELVEVVAGGRFALKPARLVDSLLIGDILLPAAKKINFQVFKDSLKELQSRDSSFTCKVYRPAYNQSYFYRISPRVALDTLLRPLPPSVAVFGVVKGGASDRAGMMVGDIILSINNQSFKDMFEADQIMRTGRSGKSIVYEVLRRNENIRLNVTLARFGVPFAVLIFVLVGCVYMAFGLFLALMRPQIKGARLLALGFALLGYVIILLNTQRDSTRDIFTFIRNIPLPVLTFLSMAILMHSGFYFPRPSPLLLRKRWLMLLPYVAAGICSLFIYVFRSEQHYNRLILLMLLVLIVPMVIFRKQYNPENKRLSRIIRLTVLVSIVLIILMSWLLNRYAAPGSAGFIGIPLLLFPASYLYTIGRYRLFDLNLRIRRNIQYSIAVMLWIMALVGIGLMGFWQLPSVSFHLPSITLTGSSIEVIDNAKTLQEQAALEKGLLMVLAVVIVLVLWKVGRMGLAFLSKHFHRYQYDYRRASQLVNEVFGSQSSLTELAANLVGRLNGLMHLQQLGVLFFRGPDQIASGYAEGLPAERWDEFLSQAPDLRQELAAWLPNRDRFTIDYLPEKPKKRFVDFGFRFLVPILSYDRVRGLFLLGEKRSESPFYQEDYQFLRSISQQVAVAVENALLYEQLAQRERLRHELEIARRIQLASLPQNTPRMVGLDIAGLSLPAMEVGGDYYDFLNGSSQEITVVVGDVSGKGISAALYMSKVQGILRSLHSFNLSPRELCIRLNGLLGRDLEKSYFVTALAAAIRASERRLILTRAGHLPLYHFHRDTSRVDLLTPKGIGFGLDQKELFANELEECRVTYQPGDVFLFVTDGVTESRNGDGQEFGEMNLMSLLVQHADKNASQLCDQVLRDLQHFVGATLPSDDRTIVVVKAI